MTIEQLKQFVADRIYTNNNFEVSALDVQEAINQVIDELFARETPDTPTLQQVLEEGNSANLDTLLEVVLTKVGEAISITPNGVTSVKTEGNESKRAILSSQGLSLDTTNTVGGSSSALSLSPSLFSSSVTSSSLSYSRTEGTSSELWLYSQGFDYIVKSTSTSATKTEGGSTDTGSKYKFQLDDNATSYEISSGDDISSKMSIHKADTVNTVNGTRGIVLTTKISADQTNDTEAAICIDGDLQIIDVEEEVVTDYSEDQDILIKDSNGVVKTIKNQNSPFIFNEVVLDSNVDDTYLASFFDSVLVEGNVRSSTIQVSILQDPSTSYGYKEKNLPIHVINKSTDSVFVKDGTSTIDTLLPEESATYRYYLARGGDWIIVSSNRV